MAKVIDIRDSESDSLFAVLVNVNNKYVAYGNNDRSKTFARWFNNQEINIEDLDSILPAHLFTSKPRNITSAQSEYSNFLPTSITDSQDKKVLIIESKTLPDDDFSSSVYDEFEEDGDEIDMWPVTDALIASIDVAYKQHLINYKVKAFILDKDISSLLLHVKGVRAVWDPDAKPGGGWRCPPTAGDTAGQFTNRFGRGCTLGATRRIGRGLISAAGDDLQKLGKLGQTLESAGERRQQGKLQKYGRRYARRTANADKTRTQVVASRIAESLESGASKLRDISEKPAGQSRRQARRIREATEQIEATEKQRRRGRRIRSAELRETPKTDTTKLRRGRRTTARKVRGATPDTPPAVDRAEKRRIPKSRRRLAREMVRDIEDRSPKQPKPKKERKIKGRKPRSTERLRDRAARRLGERAAQVLDEQYVEPSAPKPVEVPSAETPETPSAPKKRRFRFVRPKKDSDRSRRRRVALSKTNRSGLFFPTKKQTAKQKGELLPDWDTLSDDQKASVKSEAITALNELENGWRKRLGKKKKDELNEDEILDFLAELEKTDGQRAGILKTYLHNFLVLSDIEENDDFSKFNDIKPSLRKRILEAAGISAPSSTDDDSQQKPTPKPPSAPKTPKAPPAPPAPPAPEAPTPSDTPDSTPAPAGYAVNDFFSSDALDNLGLEIGEVVGYDPTSNYFQTTDSEFDDQVNLDPEFQILNETVGADFYDADKLAKINGVKLKNGDVKLVAYTDKGINVYVIEYDGADGNKKIARVYDVFDPENVTERLAMRFVPDVPNDESGVAIRELGKDNDLPHFYVELVDKPSSSGIQRVRQIPGPDDEQDTSAPETSIPTPSTTTASLDLNDRATPLLFVNKDSWSDGGYDVDSVVMEKFDSDEWQQLEDKFEDVKDATGGWEDITDDVLNAKEQPYLAPAGDNDDPVSILNVRNKSNADAGGVDQVTLWEYEYGPKDNRKIGKTMQVVQGGEIVGMRIVADTSEDDPTVNWVTFKSNAPVDSSQQTPPASQPSGKTPKAPPAPPAPPAPSAESAETTATTPNANRGGKNMWRGADVTGLVAKGDPKGTVLWVDPDTGYAVDVSDQIVVDSIDIALSATAQPLPKIVSGRGPGQVKYPSVRIDGKNTSLVPGVGTGTNPAFNSWSDSAEYLVSNQLEKNVYSRPRWLDDMRGITTIGDLLDLRFPPNEPLDKNDAIKFAAGINGAVNLRSIFGFAPYYNIGDDAYTNTLSQINRLDYNTVIQSWDDNNPPKTFEEFMNKLFEDNNILLPPNWRQLVRTRDRKGFEWRGPSGQFANNAWNSSGLGSLITKINKALLSGDGPSYVEAFEDLKSLHSSMLSKRNALIKRFQTPNSGFKESEKRELVTAGELVESLEKIAGDVFAEEKVLEEVQKSARKSYKAYVEWTNSQIRKAADRKAGKSRVGGGLDPTQLTIVPDVTRTPDEITDIVDQHKSGKLFSDVSPVNPTPAITDDEKKLLIAMKDSYDSSKLPGSEKKASSGGAAQMASLFTINGYSDLPVQVTEEEAANMLAEKDDDGKPKWVVLSRYMSPSAGVTGDDMVQQWQTGERFAAGQGGTAYGWGDYFATGPGLSGYGPAGMVILLPRNTRFADYRQMTEASNAIKSIISGLEEAVGRTGMYGSHSSARTLDINDFDAVTAKIASLRSANTLDRSLSQEVKNRLNLYVDAFVDYWLQLEMSRIPNPRSDDETSFNDEIRKAQQVLMHANASTIAVFGGYDAMTSYDDWSKVTDEQFTNGITSINMGSNGDIVVILNRTGAATIPGVRSHQDITNFLARIADENGNRVWK